MPVYIPKVVEKNMVFQVTFHSDWMHWTSQVWRVQGRAV